MTTTTSAPRLFSHSHDVDGIIPDNTTGRRGNALSNKLTSVLSSSYADTEIRDALRLYDSRYDAQRQDQDIDLKYETQKQVIEANARIIDDFSRVAKQLNRVGALIDTLNQTCDDIRMHVLAAKQETSPMLDEAVTLLSQKKENERKQQLLHNFCRHFLLSDEDLTMLTSSVMPVDERFFGVLARVKQIHKDCELLLGYENQRLGLELMEQTTRNLTAGYKKLFNHTLREFKGLDLEDPHISGSIRRSLRSLSERPALFQSCLDSFADARQSTVSEAFQKALTDSMTGGGRAIEFSTHDPIRYIGDMLAWVHSATLSEMEALEGLFISDADEISRGLQQGQKDDPFAMQIEEGEDEQQRFDGRAALTELVSRNMAGVTHTLTQRISVTIRNLSELVEIYKAYNMLSFYRDMFRKLIRYSVTTMSTAPDREKDLEGNEPPQHDSNDSINNSLLTALSSLLTQTFKHFETTALELLQGTIDDTPSLDLSPPLSLSNILSTFTQIVQTRGPNLDLLEFQKLYNALLTPVVTSCTDLAELTTETPGATPMSPMIYNLNCMALVRDSLSILANGRNNVETAKKPLESVTSEIAATRDRITESLEDIFLNASGLHELDDFLDKTLGQNLNMAKKRRYLLKPALEVDHNGPGVDTEQEELVLEVLAGRLDGFLATALMDAQEDLGKLVDKSVSGLITTAAVASLCDEFERLVTGLEKIDQGVEDERLARRMGKKYVNGEIKDEGDLEEEEEEEGEGDEVRLRDVYPRTVEEVRALLS